MDVREFMIFATEVQEAIASRLDGQGVSGVYAVVEDGVLTLDFESGAQVVVRADPARSVLMLENDEQADFRYDEAEEEWYDADDRTLTEVLGACIGGKLGRRVSLGGD